MRATEKHGLKPRKARLRIEAEAPTRAAGQLCQITEAGYAHLYARQQLPGNPESRQSMRSMMWRMVTAPIVTFWTAPGRSASCRAALLCAGLVLVLMMPPFYARPSAQRHARPAVKPRKPLVRATTAPNATSDNPPAGLNPARLVIAKSGLNAPILALGPDPTGAMQAPRSGNLRDPVWGEVCWWDVGYLPGQMGNAVIAGHINRPDASPATFTHLNWLVPGDHVQVVTASGVVMTFVAVHGGNDPTVEQIFGPALSSNLNLMTCWGAWDGKQFDRRLVVYTTLIGQSPVPGAQNLGVHG